MQTNLVKYYIPGSSRRWIQYDPSALAPNLGGTPLITASCRLTLWAKNYNDQLMDKDEWDRAID